MSEQSIHDTERAILASMLTGDMDYFDLLRESDFSTDRHRTIFNAMNDLRLDGVAPDDVVAVGSKSGIPLAELSKILAAPPAIHAEYNAGVLRKHANARAVIEISKRLIREAQEDPDSALDRAQELVMNLSLRNTCGGPRSISDIMTECIEELEVIHKNPGVLTGVPSGFAAMDRLTCGWQKSDLILVAGRPSMGKTALAINNCGVHASECGTQVGIFSLEMATTKLGHRMLSAASCVNGAKFRAGGFIAEEWREVVNAASRIASLPMHIDDHPQGYREIWRHCRMLKKKKDLGLAIIDYIGLVPSDNMNVRMSREREIAAISFGFKSMAKELKIPVILLCQLSRKCEDRNDKRPMLSDLRESGALEQDADIVVFVYRDEVYNQSENNPLRGTGEIIIAKHRNGPTGRFMAQWQERFTRFVDRRVDERRQGG